MKDASPRVSVIIPVHNTEQFLDDCLKSVDAQTYKNIEIIVVDDDSIDKSKDIIKDWQEKNENIIYIKVSYHNAALARRAGIEKSNGDYVCFVDSDDLIHKDYVRSMLNTIRLHDVSISTSKITTFKNLHELRDTYGVENRGDVSIEHDVAEYFFGHYFWDSKGDYIAQSINAKLIKKSLLENIDYSVIKTNIFEDNYILPQILSALEDESIALEDKVLYYYRENSNSVMSKTSSDEIEYGNEKISYLELFDRTMDYVESVFSDHHRIRKLVDGAKNHRYRQLAIEAIENRKRIKNIQKNNIDLANKIDLLNLKISKASQEATEAKRDYRLAINSKSHRVGRILTLPVRVLKKGYRKGRHTVRSHRNVYLLVKRLDQFYKLEKTGSSSKIKVDLVIRSNHHPTSSAFIRLVSPLSYKAFGKSLDFKFVNGEKYRLRKNAKVVIVQRTAVPSLVAAKQLVTQVRMKKSLLFVDTDDAFGELNTSHPQYELQKERVEALSYIIANADEVWFSTKQLQRLYSVPQSKVVLNTLDKKVWPKLQSKVVTPPPKKSPLRIVYMGTVTHNEDFEMIIPALDRLHQEMPGEFKLYVIGVAAKLTEKPWIEILKPESALYPDFVAWFSGLPQFDIGLSPLVDNSFNRSKSDIKCLDYLANGIKPVVSDVAAYENGELDEHIVRTANTTEDWFTTLKKEVELRAESRQHMFKKAKNGFEYITKHRSTDIPAKQIKESIEEANNRSRKE